MNVNTLVREMEPYKPGKPLEELARELGIHDAVKLASNENPRGPSETVREALAKVMNDVSRYPDGSSFHLKNNLASHLDVLPEQITVGNGSDYVIQLATRVAISPGMRGIVDQHGFVVYPLAIRAAHGVVVVAPSTQWAHDIEAMLALIDQQTRIVYIANPNNPTGTWLNQLQLQSFLDRVPPSVWVVLDEAYFEYSQQYEGYPDGVQLLPKYPNLIVTRTFSKVYGLAGLRLGYGVSNPEFADLMNRVRDPFCTNSFAQVAGNAALADQSFVMDSIRINNEGMTQVVSGLQSMDYSYIPSIGNFVTFDVGCDASELYTQLLQRGVIVRQIGNYGMPNHLRVSIGLEHENTRFLETLAKI